MNIRNLVSTWQKQAQCELADSAYTVTLSLEDAAKIEALVEMFPRRTKEQIISELVTAALGELAESFPYVPGGKVISEDELGEPIYEDVGPTPEYLAKSKAHLLRYKATKTN